VLGIGTVPMTTQTEYANRYLCPNDGTQWTADWSWVCNDRCPQVQHGDRALCE